MSKILAFKLPHADATIDVTSLDLDAQWLPEPEQLITQCEQWILSGEPVGHAALWPHLGVGGSDFNLNPLSMRVAALGGVYGTLFSHHELRTPLSIPSHLTPETAAADEAWEPQWQNGILTEPRYFSFRVDGRLQVNNSNHRRQWRPHEVLHGAAKFFWSPQMTRFEAYLGARLNELLPIVHWYGWDEIFRPVCSVHRGKRLYQEFCADCEAAAKPYWDLTGNERDELRDAARGHARFGLEHWNSEWAACLQELESGTRKSVPRTKLDASSDALGYLLGHWNRSTAWSMGAWVERFLTDGVDYYSSLGDYAASIRNLHGQLLFSKLEVDFEESAHLQKRRIVQELAYRLYLALEHLPEGSRESNRAEQALEPALLSMQAFCASLTPLDNYSEVEQECAEALDEASSYLPTVLAETIQGLGVAGRGVERSLQVQLVREGLESSFSHFEEADAYCTEPLDDFLDSKAFQNWGRLANRYLRWLEENNINLPGDYLQELRFEAELLTSAGRDEEAEHFGTIPEEGFDASTGRLRLNKTALRLTCPPVVAEKVLGFKRDELREGTWEDRMHVGVASFAGNVRALALTKDTWECWSALLGAEDVADSAALRVLLERAVAVWLPTPLR